MSRDLIQYNAYAGEISPKLLGQQDLASYSFGFAKATNWIVDYEGGIFTRPGLGFIDLLYQAGFATKYFKFQFSPDTANTYLIIFGNNRIHFMQDGAYILESPKTITNASVTYPVKLTVPAHGFASGDLVKVENVVGMTELNQRVFHVYAVTTNTFNILDIATNLGLNGSTYSAYISGGKVSRVYTVANPYAVSDLTDLQAFQIKDTLRLTHKNYPTKNLTRLNHTNWTISNTLQGNITARPSNITLQEVSAGGSSSVMYQVTAVNADDVESLPTNPKVFDQLTNVETNNNIWKLSWPPVSGAAKYNVYRSIISDSSNDGANGGQAVGFVGVTNSPQFTDNGIVPDFTKVPSIHNNPFANGKVIQVNMVSGGALYTSAPVVTVTGGGGNSFIGYAIIDKNLLLNPPSGPVSAVVILNGGADYTTPPTLIFSGGGGSGAVATTVINEITGNDPAATTLFQQREIYAATKNKPLTIFATQTGLLNNFDYAPVVRDSDYYEYDIESAQVAPLRHVLPVRGGLLLMSATAIWKFTGGNTLTVTPTNAAAEPQTYTGVSKLPPLNIDNDIIYVTDKESIVRRLSYTDFSRIYAGENLSTFSQHLFSSDNKIIAWAYAENPHKIIYCVRDCGDIIALALDKEKKVFGWTRLETQGIFQDIISIEENGVDVVYVAVERVINGNKIKTTEKFNNRLINYAEDAVCLDASLTNFATSPNSAITPKEATGNVVVFTTSSNVFTPADIGSIIRCGEGKAIIHTYNSGSSVTCAIQRDIVKTIPGTTQPRSYKAGTWTLTKPITDVAGLWHLEGHLVTILADGNRVPDQIVTQGRITLPQAATKIAIGIAYVCHLQTLPPTLAPQAVIEGHRKNIKGIALRLYKSRGLQLGAEFSDLYPMRERTNEAFGQPTTLQTKITYELAATDWTEEGQFVMYQDEPLPATVLSFVFDLEVGDDTN